MWWMKPGPGPDKVGGVFPLSADPVKFRNRSGGAHAYGEVVQLAITPGAATEIATNDSNSYIPGASNDTVWNTVIDPRSNATNGSSIQRGLIVAVCRERDGISDNKIGNYQTFGIIEDAFVVKGVVTNDHPVSGDPLTCTVTNNFSASIGSNRCIVAFYLDKQTNLTSRKLRRVYLHNGMFSANRGTATIA